ncbi:MAG: LysE family translocator [Micropruina sp.]|nr:LysE family translocator [Micropruina sp.]
MTFTQALLGFAAVAAVLTVIPGLDTTLVLRSALVRGGGYAFATALGIGTGALIWGAAAAVGAAALLAASEVAYRLVTLGGAVYLVYLGVMLIVKSFRAHALSVDGDTTDAPASRWHGFLTGVWTNLLNPKIGAFYLATIPQFIPAGASPLGMGLLLAGVHDLLAVVWFALIIAGASYARRWLANARALRVIDRIAGVTLVGFGAKLAVQGH